MSEQVSPDAAVGDTAMAEALAQTPPLAGMCALAAFCAMGLNQLLVPALRGGAANALFAPLGQLGRFSQNLAVIAGSMALLITAFSALGAPAFHSLRRRLLLVVFLTLLLRAVFIATLFDREATTKANVYLAVGAANVLCVLAGMAIFERARTLGARMLSGLATTAPLVSMIAITLELSVDLSFDPWKRRAYEWLSGSGEMAYLMLLLGSAALFVPRELRLRAALGRKLGFLVLILTLLGFYQAYVRMHADYSVLVYHAQRLSLLLDRWPLSYALPFGIGLGTAVSALIGGGAYFQAGTALILIMSAGYAPQTPGRLLCMTLGFVLLSRAIAVREVGFTHRPLV